MARKKIGNDQALLAFPKLPREATKAWQRRRANRICELYGTRDESGNELTSGVLAKMFCLRQSTVSRILSREGGPKPSDDVGPAPDWVKSAFPYIPGESQAAYNQRRALKFAQLVEDGERPEDACAETGFKTIRAGLGSAHRLVEMVREQSDDLRVDTAAVASLGWATTAWLMASGHKLILDGEAIAVDHPRVAERLISTGIKTMLAVMNLGTGQTKIDFHPIAYVEKAGTGFGEDIGDAVDIMNREARSLADEQESAVDRDPGDTPFD